MRLNRIMNGVTEVLAYTAAPVGQDGILRADWGAPWARRKLTHPRRLRGTGATVRNPKVEIPRTPLEQSDRSA
jgi:hypothetical protein